MFKMTTTTLGVNKIGPNEYEYHGDIDSSFSMTIDIPGTLTVYGNVMVNGDIRLSSAAGYDKKIKTELVVRNGNIKCSGTICGTGNVSAINGNITAKEGIRLQGKIFCACNLTMGDICEMEAIKVYGQITTPDLTQTSNLMMRSESGEWFAK